MPNVNGLIRLLIYIRHHAFKKFRRESIYKHYKLTNLKATHIRDLNNSKNLKLLHVMDLNNSYIVVTNIHCTITHFKCE